MSKPINDEMLRFQTELAGLLRKYKLSCGTFSGFIREGIHLRNVYMTLDNGNVPDLQARKLNFLVSQAATFAVKATAGCTTVFEQTTYDYGKSKPPADEMPF